ncbi:PDZ and LIM domain protein 5 isoform X11 [Emydura macquarii macquarii]|uniref:PDZ and LIM domain protein 5 isoform X11 n=1 Tax=Emydura macquarii macquarii TaxID=1129001 RepID=UPI00352BBE22
MSNYSVSLVGPAPWGFRLQGGKDFNMPLTISRLSDGGKAARAHVGIGDVVLTIDGTSTEGMTHLEAQNKIKACAGNLNMNLQRVHSAPKPDPVPVQKGEPKEVVKPVPIASAVAPKVTSTVNVAYNKTPRPFGAVSSSKITSIPSPTSAFTPAHVTVPSCASPPSLATVTPPPFTASGLHANAKSNTDQRSPALNAAKTAVNIPWQPNTYNTTLNTYSNDNAQEVAEGQRRGFKESQVDSKQQNGKNPPKRPPRKHIVDTYTEFYHTPTHSDASKKRLIEDTEDWHPRTGTTQSRSFRILAQITGTEHMKEPEDETTKKTKESQTENGDPSMSADLPNGIEAQNSALVLNKHSVATQTIEMMPASEPPSTPLPAMRPESTSASSPLAESSPVSVPSPRLSGHVSTSPHGRSLQGSLIAIVSQATSECGKEKNRCPRYLEIGLIRSRKLLFDNPLESLPRCAPHPPAAVQVLNINSQVATVTKVTSTHTSDSLEASQPVAYTAASVRSMPISPEKTDARPAAANITSAKAFKPTGPQSAVKYSGWQPLNQAAPASGWTSNNITPSGATAPIDKSVPELQLTEQDTLVQRAEHIPAGKRTPMCAHCDQVIRGPFLVALGKSWHPEEFTCAQCRTSMAYIGFVEEKGALYCEVCYEKFFAPECSRCQRKILGEVINALKQTWHISCFVCVACHNPIRNNVFHLEDGDPYCETDYYALFGTMCHGCEFPIEAGDRFLEALGHTWHDTCFVCSVCCDSLEGQTFFSKKDKPLCKKHAHSVNF